MALSNMQKGIIFMVIGTLVFLNTFGVGGHALNIIVALSSLLLFFFGFILVDGYQKVQELITKTKRKN